MYKNKRFRVQDAFVTGDASILETIFYTSLDSANTYFFVIYIKSTYLYGYRKVRI